MSRAFTENFGLLPPLMTPSVFPLRIFIATPYFGIEQKFHFVNKGACECVRKPAEKPSHTQAFEAAFAPDGAITRKEIAAEKGRAGSFSPARFHLRVLRALAMITKIRPYSSVPERRVL